MAPKVRERLAINIKTAQNFDVERFNLRKLSGLEFRQQYQMKISNRFAALEDLNDSECIILVWEKMKPRALEFDTLIEMVKTHNSTGTNQNTVELIIAVSTTISCEIQQIINSIWNKEGMSDEWNFVIVGSITFIFNLYCNNLCIYCL